MGECGHRLIEGVYMLPITCFGGERGRSALDIARPLDIHICRNQSDVQLVNLGARLIRVHRARAGGCGPPSDHRQHRR